ncbi:spermine oxidase-like isoform X1 [Maniola jurtina]|uniref:spermine oxidase-like isoform X1 n=2 Tax=Maniola jurtina TaxID=191418 RepID=UPI001E689263|nr:spermine oxidase-like isoform X1 [Maniola jurtina]
MERRLQILQWIYLASILGHTACNESTMPQSYDTIVIGLGSAGTTAASTLARAGRRVLALEAQDRIGGRVWTVPFGDGLVEVGAEWIHGTGLSRVYETALKNNISVVPQDLTFNVYQSDGSRANNVLVNELLEFCLEAVEHPPEKPETLGKFLTRQLMDYLKEKHPEVLQNQDFLDEFLELMNLIMNNYEASNDWNDVSAQTNYAELAGHQHMSWHRYGYKTFFDILLNRYNNGPGWPTLEIKLNTEVIKIKWPKNSMGKVQVVCKDGTVYTADNVIVTVSVGVLKERHTNLFDPPLPQNKIQSIENIPMGVMDKIILSFDDIGLPNGTFFGFLWRGEEKRKVSKEDFWTTRIFGCSTPMGSKTALTFWTSGEVGKLVETLPEDVVKRKVMELLRKFMGKIVTISEPTGMIRSTWYSNPFTRGSYTYDNLVVTQYPDARANLAEPLRDAAGSPRVLFAGEATDSTHFSTVHGASDSGYREAQRLLPGSKV